MQPVSLAMRGRSERLNARLAQDRHGRRQKGEPMSELNDIERGQICRSACDSLRSTEFGLSNFPGLLKKIIKHKAWECRHLVTEDGTPKGKVIELSSLRELITAKPIRGWGEDVRAVEAVIKDDPECLAMFREAMKCVNQHDAPKQAGDIVTKQEGQRETGNSRAYSIDRVKRACEPEVVAKVMSGEMSPNAALVKAGIRENRQVYIPREPAKAAKKLRELFGLEFVTAMLKHVQA